jgi:hypothetical protein
MTEPSAAAPALQSPPATVAPGPASPPSAAAPAPRAGVITDGAYDGLSTDQQDKYARVKNGDSGAQWIHRENLAAESGLNSDPAAAGGKHKFGEMEFTEQELRDFLTAKGEAELRKATLPATPEAYETKLPTDFKAPPGVDIKFDETDPLLIDGRKWAHSQGLDQSQWEQMLGLYAGAKAKEASLLATAAAAEVAKLGVNGTQRVTALETWMRGMVGDQLAGAMRGMLVTEKIVRGWETIQQKFSSQGAASFSQAHREPANPQGRASDAEYAAMSSAARLDYARSFDQSQFKDPR